MDRAIEPKKNIKARAAGIGLVVLVAGFAWLSFSSSKVVSLSEEHAIVSEVRNSVFEDVTSIRAAVEPLTTTYLDAVEGGRVEEVMVEEGDMVTAGQVLVILSNPSLQLDVISREAEIAEQINNLHNTELEIEKNRLQLKADLLEIEHNIQDSSRLFKSYSEMRDKSLTAENDRKANDEELSYWKRKREITVESIKLEERVRSTQITRLQASLANLEKNLEATRSILSSLVIKSPRSGRLTSLQADIGESIGKGVRVGQIDDAEEFKLVAAVNEYYLSRIEKDQLAILDFGGTQFQLAVAKVYPEVTNSNFRVDLSFAGEVPKGIKRGQSFSVKLQLGDSTKALIFNNGPFYSDTGGSWVFVQRGGSGKFRRVNVSLGRRTPAMVEVLDGLSPGDLVLTSSYAGLTNYDTVRLDNVSVQ